MRRRTPRPTLLLALGTAACGTAREPTTAIASAAPAVPAAEIVVANQQSGSASLIDGATGAVRHVEVGTGPHEAAVSPDGRTAVVTVYGDRTPGNRLAVIDLDGDSVVRIIDLGAYARPHGVAFLGGSSNRVVVTSEATRNVVLVDLALGIVEPVPTGARASHMIAVNAAGTRGWTANVADNSVSELDLEARRLVRAFDVPAAPEGIAVTPDGAEVWVGSNETGAVTVIATATGETIATLRETAFPYRLGASRDGRLVAIVDGQGDRLAVADVASHTIVRSIELPSPRGVAIAPDGRTACVTLAGGELAVVDLETGEMVRSYRVQLSPDGVGVGWRAE